MNAGVILAAGESRRMGFPKALLRYREETFLDTLIGTLASRCSPVIVVLGAHAERIRDRVERTAEFVINPDYTRGMTSSLQCGLRALGVEAADVLFTLVDHPAVAPATLDKLLAERLGGTGNKIADGTGGGSTHFRLRVPRYQGRRGHPIWFARDLIPEFLAIPENGAARDVVRAHATETEWVDLDDPGVVADIDDAEAYLKLTGLAV